MQIRRQIRPSEGPYAYRLAAATDEPENILEQIIWQKEREVARMSAQLPVSELMGQIDQMPPTQDFVAAIAAAPGPVGLIAEVKKASPSRGVIRTDFDPVAIAQAYERGGAACLSVLTDRTFFQGSFNYLWQVRQQVKLPLLCKEFVIDPYQIWLARASGADAVLLIAAVLSDQDLRVFSQLARSLQMRSLIEVHSRTELARVLTLPQLDMIGINNRNLEDFTVDIATTGQLLDDFREALRSVTVVSESGLHTPSDLALVAAAGASAVLVGESLIRQSDVEQAVKTLLSLAQRMVLPSVPAVV
ncbi:MAG: indole-3-glycerol phosphate synthase TrpC [Phormidesmis sp.]